MLAFLVPVAKRIGTKNASIFGVVGWIVLWVLAYFLNPGLTLLNVLLFISQVLFGVAYGLTTNLYSMCATYSHWKTGKNSMGVTMSILLLGIKLSVALRAIIIPAFLGFIAYDPTAAVFDAAAQAGISSMYFILPVVILVISLVPLLFFRIKDSDITQMNKEIAEREAAA
jgi:GPH family glycoside/pentoside/hexuronide:cation symporter